MASTTEKLPAVELAAYLKDATSAEAQADCAKAAEILKATSCLIVRDPRVPEAKNQRFLDLLERYFDQPREDLDADVHPELSYQLGATPEFTEVPRDHSERIRALGDGENAAHPPTGADPKWRFFWRIGERPQETRFAELNAPPVLPAKFPEWKEVMDDWGTLMQQSVVTVAEMVAVGLGLPAKTFADMLQNGPHLLAPTGSDLSKYGALDTIFAGFHYDLNFLTIHGKSRFPGLFIWLRDGTKYAVRVPDGCLLLQAGIQMEYLTGGTITAGFHEVVVSRDTLTAIERAKSESRRLWRISSTLFGHIASDNTLQPLPPFSNEASLAKYPPIFAGEQVRNELSKIRLAFGSQLTGGVGHGM